MRAGLCRRARTRGLFAGVLASAAVLAARDVQADEPAPEPVVNDPYDAFPYTTRHDKHYVRASLEIGGVLAVGLVDYMLSTTARGGTTRPGDTRWGLKYDWPLFRDKLIGTGLDLDTNRISTNYISHPLAGTLYFTAARSNHLSFAESYAFAILGSTTWEYFGEIREITSINDLIVTPVSGAAIGEPLMQLAGFLQRGEKHPVYRVLSFLLSPVKAVNEWTDDDVPQPAAHTGRFGLPTDPWHRFAITAGIGATVQDATPGHPRATYLDERISIDTRLANLPGYGGAGKESRLFDEGNLSRVQLDLGWSRGNLVDAMFSTRVVPFGYYVRDAVIDPADGRVRGHGAVVGLRMGFEYGGHDYDRDRARPSDIVAMASPIGVAAEYSWTRRGFEVRTGLDVSGAISSVTPYAFSAYARSHALDDVLTPVRLQGYYHAYAISAAPAIELGFNGLTSTTSLRFDSFRAIEGHDDQEAVVADGPRFADRRSVLRTTLAWIPQGTPWRLAVDVQRSTRAGDVGAVSEERSESSAWASFGLGF